jgi:hypothetical protein
MSGKLLSLFAHPEFVRRSQARAERELLGRVLPVERVSASRLRCRRCSLEYEVIPRLPNGEHRPLDPCPQCEPEKDLDALEAFLRRLTLED